MLDGARGALVALSGGPDSVALLDMLLRLSLGGTRWRSGIANLQPPTAIPRLHVAHFDHMLRGRESAEDAEFVRALADRLGLQSTIRSVDVSAAAKRLGRGVEEIARELRYDFLLGAARKAGCDRIAVGHTMTDQAETFLMRLIRGAGLRGLAAMRPLVPAHSFGEAREQRKEDERQESGELDPPSVSIIRPLLCITREEVELYCRGRALEFRTDVTNLSLRYTRNRVRSDVLPELTSINPRVVEAVSRAAENLASDQDVLDGLARSLLSNARLAPEEWPHVGGGAAAYSVPAVLEQPIGMRRRMIIEAIRLTRATLEEGAARGEVSAAHVAAVEGLLAANASGKRVTLPCSLEVWREFDALLLKPIEPTLEDSRYLLEIIGGVADVEAGGFRLAVERGLPAEALGSIIEGTLRERSGTGRDWMTVALDDSALPERLVIRPRRAGERAHVIGRRRTIKLKSLMIDHRIPSSRRASWPLVTTPDGSYIWSPGLPPALEFAAHNETRSLAMMRALAV